MSGEQGNSLVLQGEAWLAGAMVVANLAVTARLLQEPRYSQHQDHAKNRKYMYVCVCVCLNQVLFLPFSLSNK